MREKSPDSAHSLTHEDGATDKLLLPEDGLSRGDLVAYYSEIAPAFLAHLRDRPVTMCVFPDGIGERTFYRREIAASAPVSFSHVRYKTAHDL